MRILDANKIRAYNANSGNDGGGGRYIERCAHPRKLVDQASKMDRAGAILWKIPAQLLAFNRS